MIVPSRARFCSLTLAVLILSGCPATDEAKPEKEKAPVDVAAEAAAAAAKAEADAKAAACTLPTTVASTTEETAWRLFVAAVCSTGDATNPMAFETWTEQTCISTPTTPGCEDGSGARFANGSRLSKLSSGANPGSPDFEGCGPMTTKSTSGDDPLDPFVPAAGTPAALADGATFCEEVYVSAAEAAYIKEPAAGHNLATKTAQAAYINAGNTINFPAAAVEIKVNWMPASSLATPFTCANPPSGVFVEEANGVCYAMTGIHISSKLTDKWIWSTFEPQNDVTNPNRCNPDLYGTCTDNWGSTPATTSLGGTSQPTPGLSALFAAAGLPATLQNYRLTGVQTDFNQGATVNTAGGTKEFNLGSSFVEFNAGVAPGSASCISCHNSAQLDPAGPTEQKLQEIAGPPPATGVTYPPTPPYATQDFSWMLGIMPKG
jgi:hypothetical protein